VEELLSGAVGGKDHFVIVGGAVGEGSPRAVRDEPKPLAMPSDAGEDGEDY
jgi:hypothetical protein